MRHPTILKDIIYGKKLGEIRQEIDRLDEIEAFKFISHLRRRSQYSIDPNQKPIWIYQLKELKLVEPLDLRITTKTLDTVINIRGLGQHR